MTPKSLLRHKRVVSDLEDFGPHTTFHRVLWDDGAGQNGERTLKSDDQIKRVVLCTGKVYYDLLEAREERGIDDVYLMRVEQLYQFPARALMAELEAFKTAQMVWCQEEPRNMGAWNYIEPNVQWVLEHIGAEHKRLKYTGRPAAASTATGLMSTHLKQLNNFIEEALAGD